VIKQDPSSKLAWVDRAYARQKSGDMAGMTADLRRAIALDPTDLDMRTNVVTMDIMQGDAKQAIADLQPAIQANPTSIPLVKLELRVHMMQGDVAGARADAKRLQQIGASSSDVYDTLGDLDIRSNDYRSALSDYSEAIKADPKDLHALEGREECDEAMQNNKLALQDLTALVHLDPTSGDRWRRRAAFEQFHGDKADALNDYKTALKLYQQQGDTPLVQQMQNLIKEMQSSSSGAGIPVLGGGGRS